MISTNQYPDHHTQMSKREILGLHIDFLEFQVRTHNVLTAYGIILIKDLVTFEEHQILKFKNAGIKTLADMIAILADFDLHFGMTPNDIHKILNEEDPNYTAQIEEEKKYLAESKIKFVNITIPEELSDLPIESILLNTSHFDFKNKFGTIKRLQNAFTTLGDLDGHSIESLYKIRNIGRVVIKFINIWFEYFIPGSYSSISEKLDYHSDYPVLEIHSSPFLKKFINQFEIESIVDIRKLDEINFGELENWEKLCLLELRTLHTDGESFSTNNNVKGELDFIRWIDCFIEEYCNEVWKKYLILKWNDGNVSLNDVANKVGVTRERVRQIIRGEIKYLFELFYLYDNNYTAKYFLDIIQNSLEPIKMRYINKKSYKPKYNESFYLGFLNNIFPNVPFLGYNAKTYNNYNNIIKEIYSLAEIQYSLLLKDYINNKNTQEILDIFTVIFVSQSIDFAYKDEKIFINKTRVFLYSALLTILEINDKPLSLDEICKILKQSDFYKKKVNKGSVYNTINKIDEIVTIDWHVWGLKRHISYQEHEWPDIQEACKRFLNKLGHQSGAGFIYKEIKNEFPQLVSKYELIYIIRHCVDIVDLGFINFGLSKWGLDERLKIADVINNIFESDPRPKHNREIYKEVLKIRTARWEGHTGFMKQCGYKSYSPGYFGLPSRHEQNIKDLYNDSKYLELYIKHLQLDTSLETISEYFELDNTADLMEKIETIDSLKIIKDPFSDKRFVLKIPAVERSNSLYKSLKSIVKIILYNCTKPLTVDEIKYFCIGSPSKDRKLWYRHHENLDKAIIKVIKNDDNYDILPNGSILFSGDKEKNIELIEIMEEVIEYLSDLDQKISLDELYVFVSDLSDSIISNSELSYLLKTNDRIEIEEDMVILVDYD